MTTHRSIAAPHDTIAYALLDILHHPWRTFVETWNWKTAAISMLVRATIFFLANRHTGSQQEISSTISEALFAIVASGLLGALTQRFRDTRPLWLTEIAIWIVLPALLLTCEAAVHRLAHTPHLRAGLIGSFLFASLANGFTWYAMRHGTLLQGAGDDSVTHDIKMLPRVIFGFVTSPFRRLL